MHSMNKQEENYKFLLQLPLVKDLLKENKSLKKKVRKMEKLFIRHNLRLLKEDADVPIVIKQEPGISIKKTENIVYEIIEEDENIEILNISDVGLNGKTCNLTVEKCSPVQQAVVAHSVVEDNVANSVVVEVEEEEVEEEEVEEEAAHSVVVEVAANAVEVEVEVEEEEEEGEVYEVVINKKTYYVTNEIDSTIYDLDENGDISVEVGQYKKGKPIFYK